MKIESVKPCLATGVKYNWVPVQRETDTGLPVGDKRYTVSSEISRVCDDHTDDFFFDDSLLRFPEIITDEPPHVMLCQEYPQAS